MTNNAGDGVFGGGALGDLPGAGLDLPPGRLVYGSDNNGDHGDGDGLPLLWRSDAEPADGLWATVRGAHRRTGLWPLLLEGLSRSEPDRPWTSGELDPGLVRTAPSDHDVEAVLAGWWRDHTVRDDALEDQIDDASTETAPFGRTWPGLAPPGTLRFDPDAHAADYAHHAVDLAVLTQPRLGLVPAGRGADAPAAIGWGGPLNYENDVAYFCAVLRSWEERFGARLVGLGFDTLYVSVAAPPMDAGHALRVAAEHFAFCPDNVWQSPANSLEKYAELLVGRPSWSFWWD